MTSMNMGKRIIERDGYKCLYCPQPFTERHPAEIEHLDNNHRHNEIWNKTFVHHDCNCKKKFNIDLQVIANEKIASNKKYLSVSAGMKANVGTTEDLTSCQAINRINFKIAEQYALEHIVVDGYLLVREAVNEITGITKKNNNTGSQQAVYRYFHTLCTSAYGYEFASNENGQDIMRKAEN